MATNTPNYGLKKPSGSDKYNIEDFNGNANILDLQLQNLKEEIDTKQPTIEGAASSIVDGNLLARRVLVSDASGKVGTSDITIDEVNYLSGTKSNIQTQIDNKLGKTETAEKASADANGNNIVNTYATKVEVKNKATTTQLSEGLATKQNKVTVSTSAPSSTDGSEGDLWAVY